MPTYEGTWTRIEHYQVWGTVEADTPEEADEKARRGDYTETFRKYQSCTFEEVDQPLAEQVED